MWFNSYIAYWSLPVCHFTSGTSHGFIPHDSTSRISACNGQQSLLVCVDVWNHHDTYLSGVIFFLCVCVCLPTRYFYISQCLRMTLPLLFKETWRAVSLNDNFTVSLILLKVFCLCLYNYHTIKQHILHFIFCLPSITVQFISLGFALASVGNAAICSPNQGPTPVCPSASCGVLYMFTVSATSDPKHRGQQTEDMLD